MRRLCLLLVLVMGAAASAAPKEDEKAAAKAFCDRLIGTDAAQSPFAFTLDGKRSTQFLAQWSRTAKVEEIDASRRRHTITWRDPAAQIELRLVAIEYTDFPTVEWTLFFRNIGARPSPILEQVDALDWRFQRQGEEEFVLHHAAGSQANKSDYAPLQTPLPPKAVKRLAGAGGRPTNVDWSYFNIQAGGEGAIVVVGWPGQWVAELTRNDGRGLHLRAGQERLRARLMPGEEIRSPLIVVQFWRGDRLRSQNVWRRWMMAYGMPKPGGKLPPPQFVASSSRAYEEMIHANEQNQIMHIDRYLEEGMKLDYWWMDAGWYIQQQGWPQVGTWEVDPKRFPQGFRPISRHAHAKGVKILVWFEPERVAPGTWLYEKHPEWLLGGDGGSLAGMQSWNSTKIEGADPCVSFNPTDQPRTTAGIVWAPRRLAFHPGPKGQYGAVRFTVPEAGQYKLTATFSAIDRATTTDVHLLHRGKSLFDGQIHAEKSPQAKHAATIEAAAGDTIDCAVGWGNGAHNCDSTGLAFRLEGPGGKVFDAAEQFSADRNPGGPWSYGFLPPGGSPEPGKFVAFDRQVRPGNEGQKLLNLGDPAARQWLTEHVDRLLTEQGIDLYRQDFNIDPLGFWLAADGPDRLGMTENKYVAGFLAYWDELLRRHPAMLIDSCASGGRRNDLETMRRSVPLWRSDYAYEPIGHQCMTYGISFWLPYHGTGTVASAAAPYYGGGRTKIEPYAFWSNTAPSLGSGIDVRERDLDYNLLRRMLGQWRDLSRFYYGDYFPLTAYTQDNAQWIAWQFDLPEQGEGAVQAFRRAESKADSQRLRLHGLDPNATYTVRFFDSPEVLQLRGSELMNQGLPVVLKEKPAAAVAVYKKT